MTDLGKLAEEAKKINLTEATRLAFGKCPTCGKKASVGRWLKWCPGRCSWVAPK